MSGQPEMPFKAVEVAYWCLSDTEEESADEETNVVLDKSRAC
jgi:hypothetical protein